MSRPSWTPTPLVSTQQGWDAPLNDTLTAARATVLQGPFPVFEYSTGATPETGIAGAFPPGLYDRCVAMVLHSTLGWVLMYSDGTTWRVHGRAANQVDSVAVSAAALVVDFNSLLAKLRAGGVLGPPTP